MTTPLQGTASAALAINRVRYTHDGMIDLVLANPSIRQNAIAAHFGVTVGWVSRVFNSDAFHARLAERKTEVIDPVVIHNLEEKLKGLVDQSVEILATKLENAQSADLAVQVLALGTKALGYGAKQQNVNVQHSFVVALPQKEQSASAWAKAYGPGEVVDAAVVGPASGLPPHQNQDSDLMSLIR